MNENEPGSILVPDDSIFRIYDANALRYPDAWITQKIHDDLIAEFGGSPGVRDENALESALNKPRNLAYYEAGNVDMADLAAALCVGIAQNHAFVDGNKRTAFVIAGVFLRTNGIIFRPDEAQMIDVMVKIADHELDQGAVAAWIRENSQPKPGHYPNRPRLVQG